jgi:hypothetical protein
MTTPYRISLPRMVIDLVAARGDFNRMADRRARSDATALTAAELVGSLRDNIRPPWKPPGGGYAGALSHDVIHGLDITVALGIERQVPAERMRAVLAGMGPRNISYFGVDLDGIELRADDLNWSFGSGTPLHAAAADLLLVVCGRKLPPGRLRGEHADRFAAGARPS